MVEVAAEAFDWLRKYVTAELLENDAPEAEVAPGAESETEDGPKARSERQTSAHWRQGGNPGARPVARAVSDAVSGAIGRVGSGAAGRGAADVLDGSSRCS